MLATWALCASFGGMGKGKKAELWYRDGAHILMFDVKAS